jgi:hypothetical protein
MYRVPGQWHRQWTALDLIERALNMCYFRGAAKHGLGVKGPYIQRGLLCEAGARVMKCHQYFWVHA